jgi:uncharacterized SAM-binding protein YcdF (DUF218 family)
MTYFIKKLVGGLASPLVFALLLLVAALVLRQFGRRRTSTIVACLACALVCLSALAPVSSMLLSPLESAYPPLSDENLPKGIVGVVVLGSSYIPHDGVPITAAIPGDGLARIAEGVRLAKLYPGTRLVLSGGVPRAHNRFPSAQGYAVFAKDMGIDSASMAVLDQSLDTGDEARAVAKLFGQSPFLLVTSAYHMKRAMRLMERAGARPVAAPTGQRAGQSGHWLDTIRPRPENIASTEVAIHEYLGLLALTLGQD